MFFKRPSAVKCYACYAKLTFQLFSRTHSRLKCHTLFKVTSLGRLNSYEYFLRFYCLFIYLFIITRILFTRLCNNIYNVLKVFTDHKFLLQNLIVFIILNKQKPYLASKLQNFCFECSIYLNNGLRSLITGQHLLYLLYKLSIIASQPTSIAHSLKLS